MDISFICTSGTFAIEDRQMVSGYCDIHPFPSWEKKRSDGKKGRKASIIGELTLKMKERHGKQGKKIHAFLIIVSHPGKNRKE